MNRLYIGLVLAILVTETAVMLVFHVFLETWHLSPLAEGLTNSLVLVIFLLPVLHFSFYRPVSSQIARYKQALESIQELQTIYGVIIRTAMDGFWLIDIMGRILEVNDSYCRLTGYSRQELLAMSVFDLRAQEKPEDTKRHIQRIIESGGDRFESHHRCKDGRIVDLEVSVNYLDVDGGRLFAFLRDITERKLVEREMTELNILNQVLVKTIPFGMDVVDAEGNVLYLSPRLEALFGKEAIGKKCWELYKDDKIQCKDCPLKSTTAAGLTDTIETFGVFGGRSVQISHTSMEYQGKKVLLEIFQDITERKRYEEELIAANHELVKLERMKTEFITTVSHELRTPLGIMREGVSQVVEGLHGEITEGQRQYLGKSLGHMERLTRIVNSILEIANLEAGKIGLRMESVDIAALAREMIRMFEPAAQNKNVEIRAHFSSRGEPLCSPEKIVLRGDRNKLGQVFTSVIDNAVKFTEKGHIEVQIQETADTVECVVSDTGRGMTKEASANVFDKFQQFGREYGPGQKGVGLGLAITKGIIELHKGRIWIESEFGKGTKVSFSLPKG